MEGISGTFIFDTGAECLILNDAFFKPGERPVRASMGNTGEVTDVTQRYVDSLFIDDMLAINVRTHVMDLSHVVAKKKARIHGFLGHSAFQDFEIMIDYPMRLIVLDRTDKQGKALMSRPLFDAPIDSVKFHLHHHLIIFDAEVNGRIIRVSLDTGAEINLLDRLVGRRVLRNFEILRRINMSGMGKAELEVLAGVLRDVKISGMKPRSMHTLLTNLDDINEAFGTRLQGIIGYEYLQDKRFVINYKKKKIYFLKLQRP